MARKKIKCLYNRNFQPNQANEFLLKWKNENSNGKSLSLSIQYKINKINNNKISSNGKQNSSDHLKAESKTRLLDYTATKVVGKKSFLKFCENDFVFCEIDFFDQFGFISVLQLVWPGQPAELARTRGSRCNRPCSCRRSPEI